MEPLSTFAIISLVISAALSIGGTIGTIFSNKKMNEQNLDYAREAREDAQAFEAQQAQMANSAGLEMFYKTQSPQARVDMLKNAGLSPGLIYGGNGMQGGASAGAKANGTAGPMPNMVSLFDGSLLKTLSDTLNNTSNTIINKQNADTNEMGTKSQMEVNQATINKINKDIEKSDSEIRKIEEEIKTEAVSRELKEQEKRLKEQEVEFNNATFEDRVKMVNEMLRTQEETTNKIIREIDLLDIDKKYAEKLKQATLRNLNAQTAKLEAEKGLVVAQEATERAKRILTLNQAELTAQQYREVKQHIAVLESEERKLKDEISRERWKDQQYYRNRPSGSTPWAIISDAVKQFEANLKDWHIEYEE